MNQEGGINSFPSLEKKVLQEISAKSTLINTGFELIPNYLCRCNCYLYICTVMKFLCILTVPIKGFKDINYYLKLKYSRSIPEGSHSIQFFTHPPTLWVLPTEKYLFIDLNYYYNFYHVLLFCILHMYFSNNPRNPSDQTQSHVTVF